MRNSRPSLVNRALRLICAFAVALVTIFALDAALKPVWYWLFESKRQEGENEMARLAHD